MIGKRKCLGISIRRWIALGSVVWAVAAYTIWLSLFGPAPGQVFLQSRAQCQVLIYKPYGYAECLQAAAGTFHSQYGDVASTAALIAILPVIAIWVLLFGICLWRSAHLPHYGLSPTQLADRG